MKNMYRVTRPAWTSLEKWETTMILVVTLAIGLFEAAREVLEPWLNTRLGVHFVKVIFGTIEAAFVTLVCIGLIRWYQRRRIGCYPSTFIYCFNVPEISNPTGKSQVVGYCHVKPDMRSGDIWVDDELHSRSGIRA